MQLYYSSTTIVNLRPFHRVQVKTATLCEFVYKQVNRTYIHKPSLQPLGLYQSNGVKKFLSVLPTHKNILQYVKLSYIFMII
jgi:hypothetical protein